VFLVLAVRDHGPDAALARYFTDLLTRLVNGWPNRRIDELMPWKRATAETG
jgi:hypothetical protein